MGRSLTKEEAKERALGQARYLIKSIKDGLVEVKGCEVSVGVKRTPVDGEVFEGPVLLVGVRDELSCEYPCAVLTGDP